MLPLTRVGNDMDHKNFYENLDEVTFRLNGSVVRYDGDPVYVQGCENHNDGIIRLNISTIPLDGTEKVTRKMINSPKFDKFRPIPLGNLNYVHGGALAVQRLERIPARTHTQGLTSRATSIQPVANSNNLLGTRIDFNAAIRNEGFVEMCKNIYPTLDEFLKTDITECAIHADYTVVKSGNTGMSYIYHKFDKVGILSTRREVLLFPKFGYLKEAMDATRLFSRVVKDTF